MIWSGVQGPGLVAAQGVLYKSANANLRHSEIDRIRYAGIQAIGSCRIAIVIGLHHLLPEPVVANSELVGEAGRGCPYPACSDHLRARL